MRQRAVEQIYFYEIKMLYKNIKLFMISPHEQKTLVGLGSHQFQAFVSDKHESVESDFEPI